MNGKQSAFGESESFEQMIVECAGQGG